MSDRKINNIVDVNVITGSPLRTMGKMVFGSDPGKLDGDKLAEFRVKLAEKLKEDGKALAFTNDGRLNFVTTEEAEAHMSESQEQDKADAVAAEAKAAKPAKEKKVKAPKEPKPPAEPRAPAAPRGRDPNMPELLDIVELKVTGNRPAIRPGPEGKLSNTEVLMDLLEKSSTVGQFKELVKANEQVKHYAPAGFIQWAYNRKAVEITPASDEALAEHKAATEAAKTARAKKAAEAKKAKAAEETTAPAE